MTANEQIIREIYGAKYFRGANAIAARRTGLSTSSVSRIAARLGVGLVRTIDGIRWKSAEDELLEECCHLAAHRLAKRLLATCGTVRSEAAIKQRLKRLGIRRESRCGYTASRLAELMGVDQKTVSNWISRGMLRATHTGHAGGWHNIEPEDVVRFVARHPEAFKLARVDQLWFLDLLMRGKIGDMAEPMRPARADYYRAKYEARRQVA